MLVHYDSEFYCSKHDETLVAGLRKNHFCNRLLVV